MTRIGSLCSGYEGLGAGVTDVLGGELAWVADNDPGAAAILAYHFPDVPNLGDISAADWATVGQVDILTAGFPCQDVSCAGGRAGLRAGNRTGVWAYVARAIDALRPSLVLLENVGGLLSADADSDMEPCPWCLGDGGSESALRALGAVLGDLAEIGFDAQWCCLRASDAGAPHRRERVFILAWPAADARGHEPGRDESFTGHAGRDARERSGTSDRVAAADAAGGLRRALGRGVGGSEGQGGRTAQDRLLRTWDGGSRDDGSSAGRDSSTEDANRTASGERRQPAPGQAEGWRPRTDAGRSGGAPAVADASGDGRDQGRPESAGLVGRPDAAQRGDGLAADEESCPSCGCAIYYHDAGGYCAGLCGGNCADPELGRPDGGWNSFEDDADPAEVRAYALAHSDGGGRRPEPGSTGRRGRGGLRAPGREPGDSPGGSPVGEILRILDWGAYAPAIARWEAVTGRPAPGPTEPGRTGERLSPRFVEWLMGLPDGWVTDVPGLTRNAQLKALGNGVVPQQAAAALRLLLPAVTEAAA